MFNRFALERRLGTLAIGVVILFVAGSVVLALHGCSSVAKIPAAALDSSTVAIHAYYSGDSVTTGRVDNAPFSSAFYVAEYTRYSSLFASLDSATIRTVQPYLHNLALVRPLDSNGQCGAECLLRAESELERNIGNIRIGESRKP